MVKILPHQSVITARDKFLGGGRDKQTDFDEKNSGFLLCSCLDLTRTFRIRNHSPFFWTCSVHSLQFSVWQKLGSLAITKFLYSITLGPMSRALPARHLHVQTEVFRLPCQIGSLSFCFQIKVLLLKKKKRLPRSDVVVPYTFMTVINEVIN